MGSGFIIREVGDEVAGAGGNVAAVGLQRGNDRCVPRSVKIKTARRTYAGADFARILQTVCPAYVVIYGHLSHPASGSASCIKSWVFPRRGTVFLGVAFFFFLFFLRACRKIWKQTFWPLSNGSSLPAIPEQVLLLKLFPADLPPPPASLRGTLNPAVCG